jgi:hypothetical protein
MIKPSAAGGANGGMGTHSYSMGSGGGIFFSWLKNIEVDSIQP